MAVIMPFTNEAFKEMVDDSIKYTKLDALEFTYRKGIQVLWDSEEIYDTDTFWEADRRVRAMIGLCTEALAEELGIKI